MWRANEASSAAGAASVGSDSDPGATPATVVMPSASTASTAAASTPTATSGSASGGAAATMWRFDNTSTTTTTGAAMAAAPAAGTSSSNNSNSNHGVIGSGNVHAASRFLWSRMAPEEEEREEEALPSYLSYLQPAFHSTGVGGDSSSSFVANTVSATAASPFASSLRRQSLPTASLSNSASALPFIPASHQHHQRMYAQQSYSNNSYHDHTNGSMAAATAMGSDHASVQVASKSREFAHALQEFVLTQIEQQQRSARTPQQPPGLGAPSSGGSAASGFCKCEPLQARVSELELQLQTLQSQVTVLLQGGMGNTVAHMAQQQQQVAAPPLPNTTTAAVISGAGAGGASTMVGVPMGMGAMQPPLPPGGQHPLSPSPSPPPPPTGAMGAAASVAVASQLPQTGVGSAMSDRVSTLEGRQSAFQSQLAQISKVLGVPVGKHGKNSQVKTLVQTLRDEIDGKVLAATTELETKCVESVKEQLTSVVQQVAKDEIETQLNERGASASASSAYAQSPSAASSLSSLSYETVLGALAEEHEASLAKLSAYFDERLIQESKQRVGLENRVDARCSEHEEWLQQLEGEFGSWHDTSSSVAAQIRALQLKVADVERQWRSDVDKWAKQQQLAVVAAASGSSSDDSTTGPNYSSNSNGNSSVGVTKSKLKNTGSGGGATQSSSTTPPSNSSSATTSASTDALARTVQQLTMQFKHFQSESKSDVAALRENVAVLETWVQSTRLEGREATKSTKGLKQLVEKLVRDTGAAEELLQQYVSTITHQVASVTRQYVSVRIRDNNRLIDATLRARVPAYVANESESFMLVRPEKLSGGAAGSSGAGATGGESVVLKDDDDDAIRQLLASQMRLADRRGSAATVSTTAPPSPDAK